MFYDMHAAGLHKDLLLLVLPCIRNEHSGIALHNSGGLTLGQ
jgi:hypothetical protein